MKQVYNKDVPVETILKHVLRENGMLKNENACMKDELQRKSQAITAFKKWQQNAIKWRISEFLDSSQEILEEPLPPQLVKTLNKIAKYTESIRASQLNLQTALNNLMKDEQGKVFFDKYITDNGAGSVTDV